jgi:1-acyl-sn-glycerol-3-phosphate acyltransferase
MAVVFSEKSLFSQLRARCGEKAEMLGKNPFRKEDFLKILARQNQLLQDLSVKSNDTDMKILRNISIHEKGLDLSLKMQIPFSTQGRTFIEAMQKEINFIRDELSSYQSLLNTQKIAAEQSSMTGLQGMVSNEWDLLASFDSILHQEESLQKSLKDTINRLSKIEHSDWFRLMVTGAARLMIKMQFRVISTGTENIPMQGPALILVRHVHGNFDPSLMYSLISRPFYPIGATDHMNKIENVPFSFIFKKLGVLPVWREDSQNKYREAPDLKHQGTRLIFDCMHRLLLNQAIMIFPEAWPILDSHYTPRDSSEIESNTIAEFREGFQAIAALYRRKTGQDVPVIVTGIFYEKIDGKFKNIFVNFSEPIRCGENSQEFEKKVRSLMVSLSKPQYLTQLAKTAQPA